MICPRCHSRVSAERRHATTAGSLCSQHHGRLILHADLPQTRSRILGLSVFASTLLRRRALRGGLPMSPRFSVITVCRNAASSIAATSESIREQEFTNYEWVVVDGASKDDTRSIIDKYINSNRDTIISEPDDGVYFAMNKGLKLARGEFVIFLNSGDTFADKSTLVQVHAELDDSVDVLHGDVLFRDWSERLIYRASKDSAGGVDRRLLASHQSIYVRREVHLRHPFDTSLRISADYACLASLHAGGARFKYLPRALSITSRELGSISVKGRSTMAWEDIGVNRSFRKMSWARAYGLYAKTRARDAVVSSLQTLPSWAFALLPARIRRRVY